MPDLETCRAQIMSEEYRDFIMGKDRTFWSEFLQKDVCRQPLEYSLEILYLSESDFGG